MGKNISLSRSNPEKLGIPSSAIISFLDEVKENKLELHSFMLVRHGQVASEGWWKPYANNIPHQLFSLSKSFTSTAVGFAIAEGNFTTEDSVISFFKDELPANISENLKAMKIKHLLTMSTGHEEDTTQRVTPAENWVKKFLELPVENIPGTKFVYNSTATYMLSAIVQKVTGMKVLDYLIPRLFEPLGIQNVSWEESPQGINSGGWGLNLKTEDIAKFGQLYLNKGIWNGEQILPKGWVELATSKHISNGDNPDSDWEQGYGYKFWRCKHNAYRGDGAFGQLCIVMPEQDAVLAITSGIDDMQQLMNIVWKHILSNMKNNEILNNDKECDYQKLKDRLSTLSIEPPCYNTSFKTAFKVSGKVYELKENILKLKNISFKFNIDSISITMINDREQLDLDIGLNKWLKGTTRLLCTPYNPEEMRYAGSGTWKDEDNFIMSLQFYESPFRIDFNINFNGDKLLIKFTSNVNLGDMKEIEGHVI